ncbi:MAG TPA: regulatory protein RecX [Solirubrobacter sp.]|nr:regulatory protein RecX [Solirubrobacter sp.]
MHQPRARLGDLPPGPDPDLYGQLATETGPDRRREEAFDAAWRFLAHRDRTEAEVRARLQRNDVEPELIDEVLEVLIEGRYIDDAAFARRFAEDRRNLDGWGNERIERRLLELGVAREHIRAALGDHDELGAACELLARRFPTPPDTPRDLERALGFLVRKGYELELAHDALRRHAAAD